MRGIEALAACYSGTGVAPGALHGAWCQGFGIALRLARVEVPAERGRTQPPSRGSAHAIEEVAALCSVRGMPSSP